MKPTTRSHWTRNPAVVSAVAIVTLILTGCGKEKEAAAGTAGPAAPPVTVVVATVVEKTVPVFTELTARTDANDSVEIRARVKAFLLKQSYDEGRMVRAGQTLFTLDKREYEAQQLTARAQMAKAEADLAQARDRSFVQIAEANLQIAAAHLNKAETDERRLKPLAEKKAVPQQDYDNASAALKSAQADVEGRKAALNTAQVNQKAAIQQGEAALEAGKASLRQADLNLEYCTIASPINGIAGTRMVAPGNLVGQGEPTLLTTVSNVNPMRVFISISEREYLNVQKVKAQGRNQAARELELILADGSTFPHKGKIIIADRAVDLKTGTLSIIAEFPNPDALLRPGQFGRVRLAATVVDNALLVPQKAVTEMQSTKVVYIVGQDNKVALRSVTLGDRVGSDYIITEGLKSGDRVIVEGIQKARPGSVVNPSTQPASTEKADARKGL